MGSDRESARPDKLEVLDGGGTPTPLLIDFWAGWCGPCLLVKPVVARVAAKLRGRLRVVAIDVEADPESAAAWDVMSLPTILLVKDGREVLRIEGLRSEAALAEAIAPYLTDDAATGGEGDVR
jgi:thioredoxin 1